MLWYCRFHRPPQDEDKRRCLGPVEPIPRSPVFFQGEVVSSAAAIGVAMYGRIAGVLLGVT